MNMQLDKYRSESPRLGYGGSGSVDMRPVFPLDDERGFTLLEVMASLAILGMGVLMVIQLFSGGLGLARAARDHSGAVLLAREKMSEALADNDLQTGSTEGEDSRGFQWKVDVAPYKSVLTGNNMNLDIMQVNVSVRGGGKVKGAFALSSLKSNWYDEEEE